MTNSIPHKHAVAVADALIGKGYAKSYNDISLMVGKHKSYFSEMKSGRMNMTIDVYTKLINVFPMINIDYLRTGIGSPIKNDMPTISDRIQSVPCIPVAIYQQTNIDCNDYIKNNNVHSVELSMSFGTIDMIYMVRDQSMEPNYSNGDMVAVREVNTDQIINGNAYVISTASRGILFRCIHDNGDDTLRLAALNNERYSDFNIEKNDVFRIYLAIYLMRTNL